MQLRNKALSGVVQPLTYVDRMMRQQGFQLTWADGIPSYGMRIYDSATNTSYFLRMCIHYTRHVNRNGEQIVKLGAPSLEANVSANKRQIERSAIPLPIRQAVEHKLAEVADYLR
ncbi:hypothetical protein [Brevibacillus fulvus]|uniref:Uncharacterized protein n=1 Tax=Brevibacillus fulvus TaxID=1125967 RepID=A0A938Y047_9BACL|nr:hypothetical protein [Brevibacillus fulvus]MBM7590936.1 hypothetical protein [Brevibacillus fulvus]